MPKVQFDVSFKAINKALALINEDVLSEESIQEKVGDEVIEFDFNMLGEDGPNLELAFAYFILDKKFQ